MTLKYSLNSPLCTRVYTYLTSFVVGALAPSFVVGALAPSFVVGALAPSFVVGALAPYCLDEEVT